MKYPQRWSELSPLLDELLELEPSARAPRLSALRQRDAELADELDTMLKMATGADASGFLAQSAPLDSLVEAGFIGKRVGAYVVDAELGGGGTGSVWHARRSDGRFDGAVAIKLLHMSLVGRHGAARFHREGALLSRLTHPNIAKLMDAGVTAEGQPYLILEYVDGVPIDQHCDLKALDVEQRLRLLRAVMSAVMHAHAQLIVHRDIKPNNILVTTDGQVKLLDFGIAKLLEDDLDDAVLTVNGNRALTPRYAAPEQLQGAPLTTATDVYALAVLMYWLLTERHPTARPGASTTEVIEGVLATEPPRLASALTRDELPNMHGAEQVAALRSTSALRLRRDLRGDLDAIVHRALQKQPAGRYESVAAFAADIDRYLAHEPVAARAPSLRYLCGKFVRRRRGALLAGILVAGSMTAGLVGTVTQAHRTERERDKAMRQLRRAEAGREFVGFLLSEGSDGKRVAPAVLERGDRLIDAEFASDPEQRADLQSFLAQLYKEARAPAEAQALLLRARQSASGVASMDLQMQIQCQLAGQIGSSEKPEQARTLFDFAIQILRRASDADPATLVDCLHGRSELVRQNGGDLAQAVADAQEALAKLGTPRPDQQVESVAIRTTLASLQAKLGHSAVAASQFRRAVSELDAIGWGRTEMAGNLYNNLGVLLFIGGQPREAADAFMRSAEMSTETGLLNPAIAANYARVLTDIGHPQEAVHYAGEALRALTEADGPLTRAHVEIYAARAWCAVKDVVNCERLLKKSREDLAQYPSAQPSVRGQLEMGYAELADLRGNSSAGRERLQRSIEFFEAEKESHRDLMKALANLARRDLAAGDLEGARLHSGRAVRLARERMDGFDHSAWLGWALLSQALVQQRLGDRQPARVTLQQALVELRATVGDVSPETIEARGLVGEAGLPSHF
jgi:eukaryotic-like serine/threonine-protein kinase